MQDPAEATPILPGGPKPLYPDVPWWAVLVTAFACSILAVIATVFAMRGGVAVPGAPALPTGGLAIDTLVYMPHIILLFGVLGDMFTYDGVWSIPSLIGVLSIFVNYVFRYFWVGIEELATTAAEVVNKSTGASVAPQGLSNTAPLLTRTKGGARGDFSQTYDGCSVQGFESLSSEYAPQTLVVTATVFSYYCFDLVQNRGWVNSIAALTAFVLTYLGQVGVLSSTSAAGCPPPPGKPAVGGISQAARALFEGVLFGGVSYGIVKTYYPTRLPSSTVSPFPRKSASDLTMGADGKMRDADGYPYVVLPNGSAVPDFGDRQSRAAFGALVANNLGTDVPATAGCPASA